MSKTFENNILNIGDFQFSNYTNELIDKFRSLLKYQQKRMCDFSIGALILWWSYYGILMCIKDDIFLGYSPKNDVFIYPFGMNKNVLGTIDKLKESKGTPLKFLAMSKDEVNEIVKVYKKVEIESNRDWYDYIYDAEKMISLSGKKYHSKRNHITRFKNTYKNHEYKNIKDFNINDLMLFIKKINNELTQSKSLIHETYAVEKLLNNLNFYNQVGGVLTFEKQIIALTIGEIVNDTLIVHIEKADRNFEGAYPTIANYFAEYEAKNIKFINREDDMGIQGLRKAKLDYHPIELLEKYKCTIM